MTQTTESLRPAAASDTSLIASIGAAHFVSHYYILLLPPLFDFVRADYGVSYTELGLALTVFNVVSAALQIPAGFLVDRLGARVLLISGLLLGSLSVAVAGLADSFWLFVAMFGLGGLANTVYHPADYAMLAAGIAPKRISHAFSIHTFAGMLGSAVAPFSLLAMQSVWGWRGAFVGSAALGVVVAVFLLFTRDPPAIPKPTADDNSAGPVGWRLLASAPIMLNLAFFILLALIGGGLQNYSVVALSALYGTPPTAANAALTGHLLFSAFGVLAGGTLAARTTRHAAVTTIGVILLGVVTLLIPGINLGDLMLIAAMSLAGLFFGIIMPSRDMIVRAATPPGSFGTVFGFVTTGFNLGGVVSPVIFGLAMDHGAPQWVFLLSAAFCLIAVATVAPSRSARVQADLSKQ
jgi:MFS family permease